MLKQLAIFALAVNLSSVAVAELIPIDWYFGPLGQSNANGKFAPVPPRLIAPQDDYFHFWTQSGDFITADTRLLAPSYAYGQVFGAELSFAEALGNKIAITKVSKSGSPIAEWANGATMFERLKVEAATSYAELVAMGYQPTLRGAMWVQGEYDSGSQATADAYESNLTQLIADIRSEWGPQVRFVYNRLHADLPTHWPSLQWVDEIRAAQEAVQAIPNVRMIDVDDLALDPRDYLHFSPAMQDTLGQRFAIAMTNPADVDVNGVVDGADFLAWQRGDRSAETLAAWTAAMEPPATVSAPEPAAASLVGCAGLFCWRRTVRRRVLTFRLIGSK